jgi:hypothetical protein
LSTAGGNTTPLRPFFFLAPASSARTLVLVKEKASGYGLIIDRILPIELILCTNAKYLHSQNFFIYWYQPRKRQYLQGWIKPSLKNPRANGDFSLSYERELATFYESLNPLFFDYLKVQIETKPEEATFACNTHMYRGLKSKPPCTLRCKELAHCMNFR